MGVRDAIRAYNGVINWLNNQDTINLGGPERKAYRAKDEYFNNILLKFGKEYKLEMERNNSPKYKGSYSPAMENCRVVQADFGLFQMWVRKNYLKEI